MGVPHHSVWRDPALEQFLRQCILDGDSSQTCADKMGMTRSAVIGKSHRLKLSFNGVNDAAISKRIEGQKKARLSLIKTIAEKPKKPAAPPVKRDPYAAQGAPKRLRAKVLPVIHERPLTTGKKTLIELLKDECRYPTSDGLFCSDPVLDGKSYCPGHHKICTWQPDRRVTTANELMRSLRRHMG